MRERLNPKYNNFKRSILKGKNDKLEFDSIKITKSKQSKYDRKKGKVDKTRSTMVKNDTSIVTILSQRGLHGSIDWFHVEWTEAQSLQALKVFLWLEKIISLSHYHQWVYNSKKKVIACMLNSLRIDSLSYLSMLTKWLSSTFKMKDKWSKF